MTCVLTLIADPSGGGLDNTTVTAVAQAIAQLGASCGSPDWLADAIACDVSFDGVTPAAAEAAARDAIAGEPIDLCAQPNRGRRKKLLLADMDSTIVTVETVNELAAEAGIEARIAPITRRAMRGEIEFADAVRQRVAMFAELPVEVLERTMARIDLTSGAEALVRTMRANDAYTMLVSGGYDYFAQKVGAIAGFDEVLSNRLVIVDGRLTGRVVEPVLDRSSKRATLMRAVAERGLSSAETLAVGDGANDLEMIDAAGLGVAYRAQPVVAKRARTRIEHGDLTALLYMQGYRRTEFAA